MASHQFSVIRRRPNLVDLIIPKSAGVDHYRLKWATNFDASVWTTFITAPIGGFCDPSIDPNVNHVVHGKNVRIIFNPATYSITDSGPIWLKFVPVTGGVEGTASAPTLVLPTSYGYPILVISGNAPNEVDLAHALQIDLPLNMQDIKIQTEADMFVAFDVNGPEVLVLGSEQPRSLGIWSSQATLFVRGSGAVVPFSATFSFALHR